MNFTPYIVGIAGGTGSGKTTVAKKISSAFGSELLTVIEHDSYYRDRSDLPLEEREKQNFDHPDSLESSLLVKHLQSLKMGHAVEIPRYDFKTHNRKTDTQLAIPTKIILVEGILLFAEEPLRQMFDLKIFVDTDADIRVLRRIRRDIEQRGRSFESVREQYYNTVRPMHLQFVEPSKRWADIVIPEGGNNKVAVDLVTVKLQNIIQL